MSNLEEEHKNNAQNISNLVCRCYKDKRVWIMVSLVLFAGFTASVFIFDLDIGSNILYAFVIFWVVLLGALTFGTIQVIIHMRRFCAKSKSERNGLDLIGIGILSAVILIIFLVIADNLEANYNYWIPMTVTKTETSTTETELNCKITTTIITKVKNQEDFWNLLARNYYNSYSWDEEHREITTRTKEGCVPIEIPKEIISTTPRSVLREVSNLPLSILNEDKWRTEVETLGDTQEEVELIINKVIEMNKWDCQNLWDWRITTSAIGRSENNSFNIDSALRIHNSHRLVDLGCQLTDEQRNEWDEKYE